MNKSFEMRTCLKLNSSAYLKKVDLCFCTTQYAVCWLLNADNKLWVQNDVKII